MCTEKSVESTVFIILSEINDSIINFILILQQDWKREYVHHPFDLKLNFFPLNNLVSS